MAGEGDGDSRWQRRRGRQLEARARPAECVGGLQADRQRHRCEKDGGGRHSYRELEVEGRWRSGRRALVNG